MKLSNLEKTAVILLLFIVILGGGAFFFVYPVYSDLGKIEAERLRMQGEIDNAYLIKTQIAEIDNSYERKYNRAVESQKCFYDEMTTTETVNTVQKILKDGGFEPMGGITVVDLGKTALSLQLAPNKQEVVYDLRQYSFLFDNNQTNNQQNSEEWDFEREVAKFIKKGESEEEINIFTQELKGSYALLLKEVTNILKGDEITEEARGAFLDAVRGLLAAESVEIGLITADFSLELTYNEYMRFLNYINSLEKATYINSAILKDPDIEANIIDPETGREIKAGYTFSLRMYVVKSMEALDAAGEEELDNFLNDTPAE